MGLIQARKDSEKADFSLVVLFSNIPTKPPWIELKICLLSRLLIPIVL